MCPMRFKHIVRTEIRFITGAFLKKRPLLLTPRRGGASIADGTIDRSGRTKSRDILRHKRCRGYRDTGSIIIRDALAT